MDTLRVVDIMGEFLIWVMLALDDRDFQKAYFSTEKTRRFSQVNGFIYLLFLHSRTSVSFLAEKGMNHAAYSLLIQSYVFYVFPIAV